jgi:RHS repeat-associated protein
MTTPFGFAGGLHDRDTGLVRFGFRDYDPAIGRWTAKDPIDFAGGDVNLFGYVNNSPVGFVDPLGMSMVFIGIDRGTETSQSTPGALSVNASNIGYTLELPWKNNKKFVSSIPAGSYFGEVYHSPKFDRDVLLLRDVPNRDDILFHPGNSPSDTEGCILPGKTRGTNRVWSSGPALDEILKMIKATRQWDKLLGESTNVVITIR